MDDLLFSPYTVLAAIVVTLSVAYFAYFRPQPVSNGNSNKSSTSSLVPTSTIPRVPSNNSIASKARKRQAAPKNVDGPPLTLLFGSQTGTAEEFSKTLAAEGAAHGFATEVIDLEEYNVERLASEKLVIFLLATYGEGEPTDNAKEFYEWITDNSLDPNLLSGVPYAVFGLGNKTYEHYNSMARNVDARLEALGACKAFERGEGDDDSSLEEDFEKWKTRLWTPLCEMFGLKVDSGVEKIERRSFKMIQHIQPPKDLIEHWVHTSNAGLSSSNSSIYDMKNPYIARILVNTELHGVGSDRSCRHIEIDIEMGGKALNYDPGDHLGIYPENDERLVSFLGKRLKVNLNDVIQLVPTEGAGHKGLGPCTIRRALSSFTDITTPPRKAVLATLATYATDEKDKKQLLFLADSNSKEGTEEYNRWIRQDMRTITEVLETFPSVNPPIDHLLEILPRLAPRYYSISSSMKEYPGRVHVTCAVVKFHTQTGRDHDGVCSTWLKSKIPANGEYPTLPVFVRRSEFKLPKTPNTPLLLIGPGTGLAPFRGFLQERKHLQNVGDCILAFGCRNKAQDFIYEHEMNSWVDNKVITQLLLAFSRDQAIKVYVQHKLHEFANELWPYLNTGHIYICGDGKHMSKDVHKTLSEIIQKKTAKTPEQAEQFLAEMKKSGRYQQDVWQ